MNNRTPVGLMGDPVGSRPPHGSEAIPEIAPQRIRKGFLQIGAQIMDLKVQTRNYRLPGFLRIICGFIQPGKERAGDGCGKWIPELRLLIFGQSVVDGPGQVGNSRAVVKFPESIRPLS
jgi:hypothetical protein